MIIVTILANICIVTKNCVTATVGSFVRKLVVLNKVITIV